ncbi:MAG: Uma2 family endonuclease [Chloroflexaceae bacterium]|nr:Uma2 family endonuclease [Chloroflexaceae bacterium]
MVTAAEPQTFTAQEYLAQEVHSHLRHEYRNSKIIPMTGGTPAHNEITATLIFLLKLALREQPYSIFVSDQRLWIPERNQYTYPDIMVTPRPIALQPGRKDTVTSPILIAEVLSQSTRAYDRDQKFAAYRRIASFREYLLIEQDQPKVEQYVKQAEHQWLFTEHQGLETTFSLQSFDSPIPLALSELYEAINFQPEEPAPVDPD